MRLRALASFGTVLALAAGALVGLTGSAAASTPPAPVPIGDDQLIGLKKLVVDDQRHRLYLLGDTGVMTTDFDGAPLDFLYLSGAADELLAPDGSELFVADRVGRAVVAVDTATGQTHSLDLGSGTYPTDLAWAGDRLWFGWSPDGFHENVGSVDPTDATSAPNLHAVDRTWSGALSLAGSGQTLLTADAATVSEYAASPSGAIPLLTRTLDTNGTAPLSTLQLLPGGTSVLVHRMYGATSQLLDVSDLQTVASVPSGTTAFASDGATALASDTSVQVISPGGSLARTEDFAGASVVGGGLAWAGDASRLFVATSPTANSLALNVRYNPDAAVSDIELHGPDSLDVGQTASFTGRLQLGDGPGADQPVRVVRSYTDGLTPVAVELPEVTTAADGSFSFSDPTTGVRTYTYQVSYLGDSTHQPTLGRSSLNVHLIATDIAVTPPTELAACGGSFTVIGRLSGGPFPDHSVISAFGSGVPLATDGTFQATYRYGPANAAPYGPLTFAYSGDATHAPSARSFDVTVSRCPASLTVTKWSAPSANQPFQISGVLAADDRNAGIVSLFRYDSHHPNGVEVFGTTIDNLYGGAFTLVDWSWVPGPARYVIRYAGDSLYAPGDLYSLNVSFAPPPGPLLALTTSASSYAYGTKGWVSVRLASWIPGGTVSLWAQQSGSAKVLVRQGKVDDSGLVTLPWTFTRNTTFWAAFAGEPGYAPAAAVSRSVTTSARLTTSLRGWYTQSGSWRIYHRTAKKQLAVALAAPQPGKCVRVTVQQYVSSHWKTIRDTACVRLASNSTLTWTLPFATPIGAKYRISVASYAGPNPAARSAWLYLAVRR